MDRRVLRVYRGHLVTSDLSQVDSYIYNRGSARAQGLDQDEEGSAVPQPLHLSDRPAGSGQGYDDHQGVVPSQHPKQPPPRLVVPNPRLDHRQPGRRRAQDHPA